MANYVGFGLAKPCLINTTFASHSSMLLFVLVWMFLTSTALSYRQQHGSKQDSNGFAPETAGFTNSRVVIDWPSEDKPQLPVLPYSGERIRIRGTGKYINSGFVEVYRDGQWGYICDDGWDSKDAMVACKEIGFTQGAISNKAINDDLQIQKSNFTFLLLDVKCRGIETSLLTCLVNQQNECRNKVAASVTCITNQGCPTTWVAGIEKCYKFFTRAKHVKLAANVCFRENANLVSLETETENNFLSSIIKNSMSHIRQWYTAGVKNKYGWKWSKYINNRNEATNSARSRITKSGITIIKSEINFKKWFPGWPLNNNKYVEPDKMKSHNCLILSDNFKSPSNETVVLDYFYWKADKCRQSAGLHFICQMKREEAADDEVFKDCNDSDGSDYRGDVAVTETGDPCSSWSVSTEVNEFTHPYKGLGNHNYCRNPDNDVRPWCWVDQEGNNYGYCELPKCSTLMDSSEESSITDTSGLIPKQTTNETPYISAELTVQLLGNKNHAGTVEVTYNGNKGLICDDYWTDAEATVICRMLGYSQALRKTDLNFFNYPLENVTFILDDVKCLGNETSLSDCSNSPLNDHDCEPFEIAGVICQINKVVEIKLVNGSVPWEGRVQIMKGGVPGSVCDDKWDDIDASVVCKILGYMNGGVAVTEAYFGSENGQIWLDEVQCIGNETSLQSCSNGGWAKHDCSHKEDAGVKCFQSASSTKVPESTVYNNNSIAVQLGISNTIIENPLMFQVQLVGGRDNREGNVEVIFKNVKYRVCDKSWSQTEAGVICQMLGYSAATAAMKKSYFGKDHDEIILDNVQCLGNETHISQCMGVVGVLENKCTSHNLAGVICTPNEILEEINSTTSKPETKLQCGLRPYDYEENMHSEKRSDTEKTAAIDNMDTFIKSSQAGKIIGGHYAVHGAYPWQVRVHLTLTKTPNGVIYGLHHCGAVILSEYWLLSASHCYFKHRPSDFRLIVGDFHIKIVDVGEQVFSTDKIILHEKYDGTTKDNDVALIRIRPGADGRGIIFNNYVQPACLADPADPFVEGTKCMVSGWGNLKFSDDNDKNGSSNYPQIMKTVELPLISQKTCIYLHTERVKGFISKGMFCAGYVAGGIDTCDGDSGGPLICKTNGSYTVVGITSWGKGCALPNLPGVYTRVSFFLPWIKFQIESNSKNEKQKIIPSKP